jgi:hypothetical protein
VAEETGDTLWVLAGVSMEPLSLDMMIVIVVVAEAFFTKIGVLEGMLVGRMAMAARDKYVELVGGVGIRMEKAG